MWLEDCTKGGLVQRPAASVNEPNGSENDRQVALVVTTYRKPQHLRWTLTSIELQEGVENQFEVVIADDGSKDETAALVEDFANRVDFPVKFVTHPHRRYQVARCRNEGVSASSAPYLLLLDGDCVLPPDHVRTHLALRRPGVTMVGDCCRLSRETSAEISEQTIRSGEYLALADRSSLRQVARKARKARFYGWIRHPSKPRLIGNNVGVWRQDYERVNGFDENFQGWGCEDDDFGMRLRRSGVKIQSILHHTHTYHVWHPVDPTVPKQWKEGGNVKYFQRPVRLTRCLNGLRKRSVDDIALRVVGQPTYPEVVDKVLAGQRRDKQSQAPSDVEVLFLPGRGRFSGRSDCNVLVILDDARKSGAHLKRADVVLADEPSSVNNVCFRLHEFRVALQAVA